ncbi:unnamed protein product [Acanthoscelides obtectus]|uniref:Transmembrane protein 30A n=1 Tax=Acanthoscelides obtectus TaxID=200917 RepID=A0A9P0PC61_ACAOB|nr:unnamed protein product [Acanthoscelides obtectus]CAK1682950.1 CDC50 family protein chat-1 [Acanthoscelides obtectus]
MIQLDFAKVKASLMKAQDAAIQNHDSAFKQQRLPAWQPILTAGTVLPTFFVIGIAFIPVGIGLLYFSDEVKEHVIDYTNCYQSLPDGDSWKDTDETCINVLKKNGSCTCKIRFNLTQEFKVCWNFCFYP